MISIKNPARSRPLSANVKRLMKMARESPQNPDVEKIEREFTARDLAYCDMQGNIFMAAVDREIPMSDFAPVFMNSQLAGVIDYSFSRAGGMEEDDISNYLRMPILLKSPSVIVETVMWLDHIVNDLNPGESANMAVVNALANTTETPPKRASPATEKEIHEWVVEYEYAYWLGYIYRCECHMHDESSRMVYGAFNESFMHDFYGKLTLDEDTSEIQAVANQSLDAKFLEDLSRTKSEVRIDIPGRINTDPAMTCKLAEVLQKLNQSGKTVIIRAEHKQELPPELRSMAIENEFVANPVTVIDKEVSWFGQPASAACFIAEGKPLQVCCRPVVRFFGKHCAKSLYSFLEMNSTIDMDNQKNDQGTYDTFGAYVRGELKCEVCGKPLMLKKGKSGKFFLVCSDVKCRTFVWIEPKIVDDYLFFGNKHGRFCPEDGTSLTAGKGKKNVYVGCNCGGKRHFWKLDEI